MIEKPEAIIITIPMRIFEEKQGGEPAIRRFFDMMNHREGLYWAQGLGNKPRHEVLYCYLLWNGLIQYRCNISHWEHGPREFRDVTGGGFKSVNRKNWAILTAPVVKASEPIKRQGFQGFRYSPILFE